MGLMMGEHAVGKSGSLGTFTPACGSANILIHTDPYARTLHLVIKWWRRGDGTTTANVQTISQGIYDLHRGLGT
jgi:hypothetical protein